jgi:hypothetical protein
VSKSLFLGAETRAFDATTPFQQCICLNWPLNAPDASLLIAGCASTPLEAIVTEQNLAGWKAGNRQDLGRGKGTIVELIPVSESIDKWQHLATIQFLEGEHRRPQFLMEALETSMKTRCPASADWRVITEEPHSVTYEWRIHSCMGQENQTEISRILQGNDGLHRIAYTEKGDAMTPENREFWMKVLGKAYVAKGDPRHPISLPAK